MDTRFPKATLWGMVLKGRLQLAWAAMDLVQSVRPIAAPINPPVNTMHEAMHTLLEALVNSRWADCL